MIWYDKFVQQLDKDLKDGVISSAEYETELCDLDYDLQQYTLENIKRTRYTQQGECSYE